MPDNAFTVRYCLPNKVYIKNIMASKMDVAVRGVDVLIGMDVVINGDLAISNGQMKTTMSFISPAFGIIDFTNKLAQK